MDQEREAVREAAREWEGVQGGGRDWGGEWERGGKRQGVIRVCF
jgi:hypothetical protein